MRMKLLTLAIIALPLLFLACEEPTTEGGFMLHNTSGAPINVTVDGENHDLDIDGTKTFSWDFTDDEDKDVEITATGMFVLDYSASELVWGTGEIDTREIRANATCVRFINATGADIVEVYISAYNATTWGSNFLTSGATIANGAHEDYSIEGGSYDLRVVDSNDQGYTLSWLDLPWFNNGVLQEITVE